MIAKGKPSDLIEELKYLKFKDPKNPEDCTPCIHAFFKEHPFIVGMLIGFTCKHGAEALARVIHNVAEDNYGKEGGWGKR